MKRRILLVVIILSALVACKFAQHNKAVTTEVNYPMLDTTAVFDSAKVAAWRPTPAAKEYARKLFLNGIDLYVNQHKTEESLPYFYKSARIAPDAYTYLKLGEVAYRCGRFDLTDALTIAKHDPNTKPFAEMWEAKVSFSMMFDDLSPLEQALKDYPWDMKAVAEDTDFANISDRTEFKLLMAKYSTTPDKRQMTIFRMFESNFPKGSLPYEIIADSLDVKGGNNIDFMYADIIPALKDGSGEFTRGVSKSYEFVAEVPVPGPFHTFVYRALSFYEPMNPVKYYTATVDTMGNNIDALETGCFCSPQKIQTLQIDSAGNITLQTYKQEWKYDPLDSGYEHNSVTKRESLEVTRFAIQKDGKIIKADDAVASQ
jgi:hypothetical protein